MNGFFIDTDLGVIGVNLDEVSWFSISADRQATFHFKNGDKLPNIPLSAKGEEVLAIKWDDTIKELK